MTGGAESLSTSGSVSDQFESFDEHLTIAVSNLGPGTYMLRVVKGRNVKTWKFIALQ